MLDGLGEALGGLAHGLSSLLEWLVRGVYHSVRIAVSKPKDGGSRLRPQHLLFSLWPIATVCLVIGSSLYAIFWLVGRHERPRDRTREIVEAEAERVWKNVDAKGRPIPPENGDAVATDAWGQPIRVTVERRMLNDVVTVTSPGPDGDFDTIDDIFEVRTDLNRKAVIAEEAAKRLLDLANKRGEDQADPEE